MCSSRVRKPVSSEINLGLPCVGRLLTLFYSSACQVLVSVQEACGQLTLIQATSHARSSSRRKNSVSVTAPQQLLPPCARQNELTPNTDMNHLVEEGYPGVLGSGTPPLSLDTRRQAKHVLQLPSSLDTVLVPSCSSVSTSSSAGAEAAAAAGENGLRCFDGCTAETSPTPLQLGPDSDGWACSEAGFSDDAHSAEGGEEDRPKGMETLLGCLLSMQQQLHELDSENCQLRRQLSDHRDLMQHVQQALLEQQDLGPGDTRATRTTDPGGIATGFLALSQQQGDLTTAIAPGPPALSSRHTSDTLLLAPLLPGFAATAGATTRRKVRAAPVDPAPRRKVRASRVDLTPAVPGAAAGPSHDQSSSDDATPDSATAVHPPLIATSSSTATPASTSNDRATTQDACAPTGLEAARQGGSSNSPSSPPDLLSFSWHLPDQQLVDIFKTARRTSQAGAAAQPAAAPGQQPCAADAACLPHARGRTSSGHAAVGGVAAGSLCWRCHAVALFKEHATRQLAAATALLAPPHRHPSSDLCSSSSSRHQAASAEPSSAPCSPSSSQGKAAADTLPGDQLPATGAAGPADTCAWCKGKLDGSLNLAPLRSWLASLSSQAAGTGRGLPLFRHAPLGLGRQAGNPSQRR